MNAMMLVGQYNARMTAITPAEIRFENGVPFAPVFDDVFHSVDGGVDQSTSVFLGGNGLPERWQNQPSFQILETGFGIGLNFLVTWNAWRNTVDATASRLHFISFEKHPLTRTDLAQVLRPHVSLSHLSSALLDAWPPLVAGVHQLEFEQGHVILTLVLGDIQNTLPQFAMAADAVFLDGFSPEKNHEMWNDRVIRHIARQSLYRGTLATWCVAGAVRRLLELHGYTVQRRPGFGRKRERLEARFDRIPVHAFERMVTPTRNPVLARVLHTHSKQRSAMIVGAGVAGCLMAERLSRRGWHVDLFDRQAGPAQETSGNPAGVIRPVLSLDDNLASRLGRAAFFQTLRTLHRLQGQGRQIRHKQCGVLVLAVDEAQALLQRSIIAHQHYLSDYVEFLEPAAAGKLSGTKVHWGGWYFPQGGWVDPVSLCNAALAAGGDRIRTHWN
ncbi:MAG: tRNA (5-methylaminomethyl-2-thiouridine)(34)-methyltransferase MnmD, partial [Betaproteobacteria bacterium]|nr:tRNA (5-methylaminomethyl-2-thiouridine)(34)-methyltransferase MnmD [Betaproteobacteria bacterium]